MTSPRSRSLAVAHAAAKKRALSKKRHLALRNQIALAAMYNALPAHLKVPKKNNRRK
jgi:hypothetical protein